MLDTKEDIKSQLVQAIDVVDYIRTTTHPDWDGNEDTKIACPMAATRHESGDDSSPSFAISPSNGAFRCYGCGWKGTSIVGYATDAVYGGRFKYALAQLFSKFIRQTIDPEQIKEYHLNLLKRPRLLQKIAATRGWTEDIVRRLKIGWDSQAKRTVIPIFNRIGYCVDVRLHDTLRRAPLVEGKRLPIKGYRSSRTGDWFPVSPITNPFKETEVWIVEGEPDAVLATCDGLNVLAMTGGAGVFSAVEHDRLKVFEDKDVIVCLDNDKAGQDAAEQLTTRLTAVGVHSLKNVVVPNGNDISDFYLRHGGSAQTLRQYAGAAQYLIRPRRRNVETVALSETSQARHMGKSIKTNVIVSGKADAPHVIPQKLKLTCHTLEPCANCPCKATGSSDYFVHKDDPDVLDWLYTKTFEGQVKKELKLARACQLDVEVKDWQNMEQVTLIPAMSNSREKDEGDYSVRRGYYLGHGIESNNNYLATATPTIHPKTKESVLLLEKAQGTYDSIDKFALKEEEVTHLRSLFCDHPRKIIKDICEMLAHNHTHIYGRWDVHAAVDLVFHSPRDFTFADVKLPKGSMELLLFGDTRCGKGQIAEGLVGYYDLGQVVSGENASFMGLCGGAQKAGDNFQLSWGAIPLNNGRLVVIDEFSGLDSATMGKLSRIRSEGIAEINKGGINSRTRANARLIWVANPDKGREVDSFANGVSAVQDLIKANEDIARFDLAVVVKKGEVSIAEINTLHTKGIKSKYNKDDLRKVVLWAWSRKPEHVVFTRQATESILASANLMAETYSATIPLIQGENARFKIAKMAAAIACRCFSTEDGVFLKVTEQHAKLAVSLIEHFYKKPAMGYKQFSDIELGTRALVSLDDLDGFFGTWDAIIKTQLVDGLLTSEKFGVREMQDWCDVDANVSKKFIGVLVRCRAVKQLYGGLYVKKPSFIKYLKIIKKGIEKDG
tara:strand:- start:28207 stop:31050 length:2844 start_codon:yes stop_codon:yes gene_type:complete